MGRSVHHPDNVQLLCRFLWYAVDIKKISDSDRSKDLSADSIVKNLLTFRIYFVRRFHFFCVGSLCLSTQKKVLKKSNQDILDLLDKPTIPCHCRFHLPNPHSGESVDIVNRILESTQNYCIFLLAILKLSYSESRTRKTIQLRTAGNNSHRLYMDCTRQVRRSIPLPSMWHFFFLNSAFDKTLHKRYLLCSELSIKLSKAG